MKVAVLGAGYAGLAAARRLDGALPPEAELVVVDDTGEHLVRHELHRVIRRPGLAEDLRVSLAAALDDARVVRARVTDVDPGAGRATFEDGGGLDYDVAAVCLGSETEFYDLPGVEANAHPLKTLEDARAIRSSALDLIEGGGRIVVGGAGLSGIQVAGELAALAREEGAGDAVEIVLVERLDDVAPGFSGEFRSAIRDELADRDVEVRTGATVTAATEDRVELDGGAMEYDAFVWTGGIRGPSALGGERASVRGSLRLGDGTFVVGDAARVIDRDGEPVPATAQAAIREARTAATNVRRLVEHRLDGDPGAFEPHLEAFDFEPRAWVVSVGDGAVAQVGPSVLRGRAAAAVKASAGVGYLTSVGAIREALTVVREELGYDYE